MGSDSANKCWSLTGVLPTPPSPFQLRQAPCLGSSSGTGDGATAELAELLSGSAVGGLRISLAQPDRKRRQPTISYAL